MRKENNIFFFSIRILSIILDIFSTGQPVLVCIFCFGNWQEGFPDNNVFLVLACSWQGLADWIIYCQFGLLLVKGDIFRTRRQSLYYRIQSEKTSLDTAKHGGDTRLVQARNRRVKVIFNIDCSTYFKIQFQVIRKFLK